MIRHPRTLSDATVVCLSSIDWAFNWQIPQEVASALAGAHNRVLYVENTGVRRPGLRDAGRLKSRLANWWRARGRVRPLGDGLDLFSPVLLPFPYSATACRLNASALQRVIQPWIGRRGHSPIVVVTFLPTPLACAVARALKPDALVYYNADRLAESSPGAQQLIDHERALIRDADLVFTSSVGLLESASRLTRRATLLTSGVRFDAFQRARAAAAGPRVLAGAARPIAGFVGSIRNELDLAMLSQAARLAPDVTFVLAGPVVTDVGRLAERPNVRLLGPVNHDEAIRLMLGFDAGLLPYVINRYTADLMPVKLKEYLAAGLPVVSTGLPQVRQFVSEHGPVVSFANDAHGFVAALRSALDVNSPALVARRLEIARGYDWPVQIGAMSAAIADLVAGPVAAARAAG